MGLALDELNDGDEVHKEEGFVVVIEKELLERLGGVKIDFQSSRWMGSGFFITPTYRAAGACC